MGTLSTSKKTLIYIINFKAEYNSFLIFKKYEDLF